MSIGELLLLGAALSADAMSVTLAVTLASPNLSRARALSMPLAFGLFQGLMPALGFALGSLAAGLIGRFSGVVTFVVLGAIGAKMLWDGAHGEGGEGGAQPSRGSWLATLLAQAVATSIDALAVGVSLAASGEPMLLDACVIALCTFALCCAVLAVGRRFGRRLGDRAQLAGGAVLVLLGLRALLP